MEYIYRDEIDDFNIVDPTYEFPQHLRILDESANYVAANHQGSDLRYSPQDGWYSSYAEALLNNQTAALSSETEVVHAVNYLVDYLEARAILGNLRITGITPPRHLPEKTAEYHMQSRSSIISVLLNSFDRLNDDPANALRARDIASWRIILNELWIQAASNQYLGKEDN